MPPDPGAPEAPQDITFGLFDWIDAAPGRTAGDVYQSRLDLLAEADRGGFSVYHLAEHHGTPLGLAPSPALFLAAAARATERIRLAPTTFIVPLYDPLRLVQEICMLDQLSDGRLEIGVGKGSSPHETAMFGLTPPEAADRFEELMPAILEALETGVFRRPGPDGNGEPVALHVSVRQRPHPPLWYPTSNPASIPRLGEEGYNVIFGFGFFSPPLAAVREQSRLFFARFSESSARGRVRYALPGVTPRFGMMRHVVVAPTDDEALALLRPAFADHHTNFTHLWRLHGDEQRTRPVDVDQLLAEGKLYAGSPETVARRVAEAVTDGEVNHVAGSFAWGSLDPSTSLRSVRLFRDEVIPAVRGVAAAVGA
ncbi:LLM class flavin-dependent oxidoreductase [Modestobacter excelsi]|uniref:LLM class flavin-dependent oxidoreductase n=1 Tax=Modestobacter excelsi TaxID=2213161 RepID=UPI00110CC6E9|nr:LLM class flavin-dependent oxidoreductase [Modestobacter excelsi]